MDRRSECIDFLIIIINFKNRIIKLNAYDTSYSPIKSSNMRKLFKII